MDTADQIVRRLLEDEDDLASFSAKDSALEVPAAQRILVQFPESLRPYIAKAPAFFVQAVEAGETAEFYENQQPWFDSQFWWPDVRNRRGDWTQHNYSNVITREPAAYGGAITLSINEVHIDSIGRDHESTIHTVDWHSPQHAKLREDYALWKYYAAVADYYTEMETSGLDPLRWVYQSEGDSPEVLARNRQVAATERAKNSKLMLATDRSASIVWW